MSKLSGLQQSPCSLRCVIEADSDAESQASTSQADLAEMSQKVRLLEKELDQVRSHLLSNQSTYSLQQLKACEQDLHRMTQLKVEFQVRADELEDQLRTYKRSTALLTCQVIPK